MKKSLFILICIISIFFSKISFANDICNERIYYIIKSSTVRLNIKRNNNYSRCTGIIIKQDKNITGILTAQHCTDEADEIYIDRTDKVTVIKEANNIDVAYIETNNVNRHKQAIKIAKYNITDNQRIYVLGYPSFLEVFSCGNVLTTRTKDFVTSNKLCYGVSGGGAVNFLGELNGIAWGIYTKDINLMCGKKAIITHIEPIRKFLESIEFFKKDMILVK